MRSGVGLSGLRTKSAGCLRVRLQPRRHSQSRLSSFPIDLVVTRKLQRDLQRQPVMSASNLQNRVGSLLPYRVKEISDRSLSSHSRPGECLILVGPTLSPRVGLFHFPTLLEPLRSVGAVGQGNVTY